MKKKPFKKSLSLSPKKINNRPGALADGHPPGRNQQGGDP